MPARVSESVILRTYPFREADLIVSFFTRDLGKLRGVARRARKPGNRFGSGLERLSYVRATYYWRENRELATLDACELVRSRFELASDYATSVASDFFAEVSEHLLPAAEPSERFFRLLVAMSDYLCQAGAAGVWPAVTYFSLWAVKLSGFLPPLEMTEEERTIAEEMLRTPIGELPSRTWSRQTAAGFRRRLIRLIEDQVERKLVTFAYLEAL
jgi:DNA repair protein RecO (recombination protein O)